MSIPNSYSQGSIGGGTSPSGDVKFQYKGFTQTKNSYQLTTKVTYQGTKQKLQNERDKNSTWAIGYDHPDFGRIDSVQITQQGGPFWKAVLTHNKVLNNGITINIDHENQPQEHSVDIIMYSAPIQKHPNYDFRWNHVMFTTKVSNSDWNDAEAHANARYALTHPNWSVINPQNNKWTDDYADFLVNEIGDGSYNPLLYIIWGRDLNEKPRQNRYYYEVNPNTWAPTMISAIGWGVREPMQKPGIQYWNLATYSITESGRYNRLSAAQWALKTGGLITYPSMGDFGIQKYYHPDNLTCALSAVKGYWLCEGGQINYDGKYYNASVKYTWCLLDSGWDQDVYQFYDSISAYQQASIQNKDPLLDGTVPKTTW